MATPERDPLVSYRLGAVRVGVLITLLALASLVAFRLIPGHGRIPTLPYIAILVAAASGAAGVRLLPWDRLFAGPGGVRAMYAWSVLDILLVTAAVGFTGGGGSELFLLYGLTTVFFGAAYPPKGQVGLLAFTFACYLSVLAATGWHLGAGVVFFRCASLGMLAVLVSFLSAQLIRHINSLTEARTRTERWAELLKAVAASARRMTLDSGAILDGMVDGVVGLGFDAASVSVFDHETVTFFITNHRSLPEDYVQSLHSAREDMPALVRESGRTVVVDPSHPPDEGATLPLRDRGFGTMIACPVWVDGWLAAALVGFSQEERTVSPQDVEAFELLASQAGLALQNAQRFEETLRSVERLEELDRLKDDFLATASHELRTPLTVIMGSGFTLEQQWDQLDEPLRRELLQAMNKNAKSLDTLIASLLDFARLGADSVAMSARAFPVGEAVGNVVSLMGMLFDGRPLTVECDSDLMAVGDPVQIERVLQNLLWNAAKHTPAGTYVTLSARADGGRVVLSVADDGPGISEEELRHLGERFYRGGDLNARSTKGLGLGLALVKEILELHGSALEIESQVGIGSRFAFRLLAAKPDDEEAAPTQLSRYDATATQGRP